ncbi:MAG TPA: CHASE2 domain-containing protein [Meiothermus sp.]|nr:CHASE2 domain-containing protein [Meiothermus sp.]
MKPGLRETLLLTALAAAYFVVLNWAASCRCLGTVSDSLADLQDKTLDLVSRLEYRRAGPNPQGFPPVRLVQIDEVAMHQHSPGTYVFNRGSLARLLSELDRQKPRAVFVDLDLSQPTNEPQDGPRLSRGDQELLAFLRQPRRYPLLLTTVRSPGSTYLLGEPLEALPWICLVSPLAIRDDDLRVRRIPRAVDPRNPYPASEALARIARGEPCPQVREDLPPNLFASAYGGIGSRMVFRELELWRGLLPVGAGAVLGGKTPGLLEDSLVLVGRVDPASLDQYPTPVGLLPGVVIHANELLTLLTYGRNVQVVSPLVGVPLAFGLTLLVLLLTPLLSRLLLGGANRLLARLRGAQPESVPAKLDFLERPLMWGALFLVSAWMLHRSGVFLDYIFPIIGLELARVTRERKVSRLFTRIFRWALRA